jgi:predicted NAD/FAD-binding protein
LAAAKGSDKLPAQLKRRRDVSSFLNVLQLLRARDGAQVDDKLDSVQKFLNDALYHRHVENAFLQAAAPLVLRLLCSSCTSMDRQAMIACLSQAHSHLSNAIEDVPPSQINSAMSIKKAVVLLHASMHDKCVAVSVRSWRENTHVVQEQCGRHARGSSRAARWHQQQQQPPQQAIANTPFR